LGDGLGRDLKVTIPISIVILQTIVNKGLKYRRYRKEKIILLLVVGWGRYTRELLNLIVKYVCPGRLWDRAISES
jgi:hypothetical protein